MADELGLETGSPFEPGNIDLTKREKIPDPETGGISTVRSMSFEDKDGREVLVPTAADGKILTNDQAIARYEETGEHLGKFANPEDATAYAQWLHERQAEDYGLTKPTAQDAMTEARLQGHSWGDIMGYLGDAANAAAEQGYQPHEVDQFLGYKDPTALRAGLRLAASDENREPLPEPPLLETGLPDLSKPAEIPEGVPQSYADAMAAGEVRGPQDYARHYADMTGGSPDAAAALAAQLPSFEDATDHAIAIAHGNGDDLTAPLISTARRNLLDLWAQTGVTPQEALAGHDPVLHDAITTSREPGMPTVDEAEAAIGKAMVDPMMALGEGVYKAFDYMFPDQSKAQAQWQKSFDELLAKNKEQGNPPLKGFADLGVSPLGMLFGLGLAGEGVGAGRTLTEARMAAAVKNAKATVTAGGEPKDFKLGEDIGPHLTQAVENGETGFLPEGTKVEIGGKTYEPKPGEDVSEFTQRLHDQQNEEAKAAVEDSVAKLGNAKPDPIIDLVQPPGISAEHRALVTKIDDDLNRLRTNAVADLKETQKATDALRPEWKTPEFQEKVYHENEARLADKDHVLPDAVKEFNEASKAYADRQHELAKLIDEKAGWHEPDDQGHLLSRDEGYVRRVTQDRPGSPISPLDPDFQRDPITGARPRTLSKYAPSVKNSRVYYVWDAGTPEVGAGRTRLFRVEGPPSEKPTPDWIKEGQAASGHTEAAGRWFALGDKEQLDWYRKDAGPGNKTHYVDIPTADLEKYRVSNSTETIGEGRSVKSFSRDPDKEFFVPRDIANRKQEYQGEQQRIWGATRMEEAGVKFGDTQLDPVSGGNFTVRPATTKEIEANTSQKYYKNYWANTVDNVAKLERVNRNLDFLNTMAPELEAKGLLIREKPGQFQEMPQGMKEVHLPGIKGYADARIANVLNDFWNGGKSDLDGFFTKANRLLMNSLFITPIPHAWNVANHWAIGRGLDWINPMGYYRLYKYGGEAMREIETMGPRYINSLREGSGLQLASVETENFYRTMMQKQFHEQMADAHTWGSYARTLGFQGIGDLVKAELKWSRWALWRANDIFLLMRQFELEGKGMSTREAIFQAEKDIPNYRIPSEVMGSHAMSEFLKSPNYMNFGRYRYGQIRALALNVRDLVSPHATIGERLDAAAKLTILYGIAQHGYPLLNSGAQQMAGAVSGGAEWAKHLEIRPGGPFSLIGAIKGFTENQRAWAGAMSSFVGISPVLNLARMFLTNKDYLGNDIVSDKSTPLGKAAEITEGYGGTLYPIHLAMQALMAEKGGLSKSVANLLGSDIKREPPTPEQQAKYDKRDAAIAAARERKDDIETWVRNFLNEHGANIEGPPAAGGGGHSGGSGRGLHSPGQHQSQKHTAAAGYDPGGIVLRGGRSRNQR